MSILDALKTQTNSIDDLATLPQAMIMQMAQKGQIRQDMLAPILGRKAEMAEAVARTRALQGQGGQQPTVMEQIMARNAEAETPMPEAREMGVAQLPIREGMFDEQRMAGGGIVAFDKGGDVNQMTDEERAEYIKNNEYLQRSQALRNIPIGFSDFIKEYNPITGSKFREGVANIFSSDGMSTYEKGRKARTGEIPMFVGEQPTEKGKLVAEGKMRPDQSLQEVKNRENRLAADADAMNKFDQATAIYEKERAAKLAGNKNILGGNVTTKGKEKPVETAKEDAFSKYEKMLMDAGESSKEARNDARNMRLLEAGLNIMGGESPYAFYNIGKGAAAAAKGYGEDVKGFRKDERERIKDLMEIQKERSEMDYKGKLLKIQELAATKPDSTSQIIALGRKAGLDDRALVGLLAGNKDTENSAKNIATKAYFDNPMLQQKHGTLDKYLSAQGFGVQAQLPPGIPPNSVQIGTSKGKPVFKAPDGKQYVVD
jgi:hypothetical protein